jgi:hypothetical protein
MFVLAAVLFLARIAIPHVTFASAGTQLTLGQGHAICSTALGVIATAEHWQGNDCAQVALAYDGLNVVMAAAVVCLVLGLRGVSRRSPGIGR